MCVGTKECTDFLQPFFRVFRAFRGDIPNVDLAGDGGPASIEKLGKYFSEKIAFDQTCPWTVENSFVGLEACCELAKNALASLLHLECNSFNEIDLWVMGDGYDWEIPVRMRLHTISMSLIIRFHSEKGNFRYGRIN